MKFNVSSSLLSARLQAVKSVIATKSSLQILEDVLFELRSNQLILTASDGETTIRTTIEVDNAEGEGKVASNPKLLIETLKELSEQPVTFVIDDNNFGINMTTLNGTFSFVGANGNEYPEMPGMDNEQGSCVMAVSELMDAISKTIFCAAEDELRPVMNGIFFDLSEEQSTLVATDAHRLVKLVMKNLHSAPASFILPKKPAKLLAGALDKKAEDVRICFNDKNIRFEWGTNIIVCRQIEGRYPNYNAVIPQKTENNAKVNRKELIDALNRAILFSPSKTNTTRFHFMPNKVEVDAQDIEYNMSSTDEVDCEYVGNEMTIGFNGSAVLSTLSSMTTDEININLTDPTKAALFYPSDNENYVTLIMPIMV